MIRSPRPLLVRGARTRNLKGVDLDLELGGMVALVGPSGSGKTSLAIDTLHAESQRRYVAALGGETRGPRTQVDLVTGLPPTVAIEARPQLPATRTVGQISGLSELLAALYTSRGQVHGAAGQPLPIADPQQVAAELAALPEGSRLTLKAPLLRGAMGDQARLLDELRRQGFARIALAGKELRLDEISALPGPGPHDLDLVLDRIRVGPDRLSRIEEAVRDCFAAGAGRLVAEIQPPGGAVQRLGRSDRPWDPDTDETWPRPTAEHLLPLPDGSLGALAERCRLGGPSFVERLNAPLSSLPDWLDALGQPSQQGGLMDELRARVDALVRLGLGHLPLSRKAGDLAMGERGRLVLATRTSGHLADLVFIIDEPSSHLDAAGVSAVRAYLEGLRAEGATLLVIDHHAALVRAADRVIEFGPGAGHRGGQIVYDGHPDGLARADTATGRAWAQVHPSPPARPRPDRGSIQLRGARGNNLRGIDLSVPLGALTAVVGPSGAGKRSLVIDTFGAALAQALDRVASPALPHAALELPDAAPTRLVRLERSGRSRSNRSCVATAAGAWTPIRALLAQTREARIRGFGPEQFSFNASPGRCSSCDGVGSLGLDPSGRGASAPCPACEGARFGPETRSVRWQGLHPGDLLKLDVDEALALFSAQRRVSGPLRALAAVGLGHLPLGRPTGSLSGGEYQRMQLAVELARAGDPTRLHAGALADTILVLEPPAAGLHAVEAEQVAEVLAQICDAGATVLCVAYHPAIIARADQVVALGPGAGPAGGARLDPA